MAKKSDKKVDEIQELSEEQVYSVLEFAQSFYNATGWENVYTPDTLRNLLINLNNQQVSTNYDKVVKALQNAKDNGDILCGYNAFMEDVSMLFKRVIRYYEGLLAFDLRFVCTNASGADYKSEAYKKDKEIVARFLDNFDYKEEFRRMTLEMLRHETVFTWFRSQMTNSNSPKYCLQIMPQNRCKLTGYFESGLLYDFDMQYFFQPAVDIDAFDPVFKRYYNELFETDDLENYRPTNPLNRRDGSFATYVQTSPEDGAWCFKFDTSNFKNVPFLSALLKDILSHSDMEKLQRDKNFLSAFAILYGEIEMLDKQKTGSVKDATAFSPQALGQFMSLVKAGLNTTGVKPIAMPLTEAEFDQYQDYNKEMYHTQTAVTAGISAGASRVLFSSDKMSQEELHNALMADYNTMKHLYSQFNNFLNMYINTKTRKFKFKFELNGCSYPFEREMRKNDLIDMADRGLVANMSYWASAIGVRPVDFERSVAEAHYGNLTDMFTVMQSIHTLGGEKEKGRPKKQKVTDSGETSREYSGGKIDE